jgi:hypothetical protein
MREEKVIWLFENKTLIGFCYFTQLDQQTVKIVCFEIFETNRSGGKGTKFFKLVETELKSRQLTSIILEPTYDAELFWMKNGFKSCFCLAKSI